MCSSNPFMVCNCILELEMWCFDKISCEKKICVNKKCSSHISCICSVECCVMADFVGRESLKINKWMIGKLTNLNLFLVVACLPWITYICISLKACVIDFLPSHAKIANWTCVFHFGMLLTFGWGKFRRKSWGYC